MNGTYDVENDDYDDDDDDYDDYDDDDDDDDYDDDDDDDDDNDGMSMGGDHAVASGYREITALKLIVINVAEIQN